MGSTISPKKILIYIDCMATGGAARVASIIMDELVKRGYQLFIETDLTRGFFYNDVPSGVTLFPRYNKTGRYWYDKLKHHVKLWKRHRKTYTECMPDVVIAFQSRVFFNVYIATRFLKDVHIIASDHTAMDRDLGKWQNFIRHYLYSLADKVTILTEKDNRILGEKIPKKVVIPNPLPFSPLINNTNVRDKTVLVVGRLDAWDVKGFDRIIDIWRRISPDFQEWKLAIAGPGPQPSIDYIFKLIRKANIESTVEFLGYQKDITQFYRKSSIFALPSRVEGFPMVLIEAMSQGCASISFSMGGAIQEIITNNEDGIIIKDNDVEAFEHELRNLIQNENFRQKLSDRAIENIARFSPVTITNKWEQLITDTLSKK